MDKTINHEIFAPIDPYNSVIGTLSTKQSRLWQFKRTDILPYPRNTTDHFRIARTRDKQVDYNLKTGDSTVYKLKWEKDCHYSLTFVSSSEKKSAAERALLSKYKLTYEVLSVTPDYYVYNLFLDKVVSSKADNFQMTTDTAWLKPITSPANTLLFEPLKEKASHLKRHFNDTSSYAILYFYRPHAIPGMMTPYLVYFGLDVIFPAANSTKAAYKVFREGPVRIHAKMNKYEAHLPVEVKFGKKYYIQCLFDNFPLAKPVIKLKEEAKGQVDFDSL